MQGDEKRLPREGSMECVLKNPNAHTCLSVPRQFMTADDETPYGWNGPSIAARHCPNHQAEKPRNTGD